MEHNHSPEATASLDRHYEILSDVRRSVRYHDHRRRFYFNLRSMINIGTMLAGSAVMGLALATTAVPPLQWGMGALVAVLAVLDLAAGTVDKAILHTELYRRFIRLEQRLLDPGSLSAKALTSIESEQLDIEIYEPSVYHALNRSCHNEILRSEGRPELFETLSWFHRTFRNILHFPNLPPTQRSGESRTCGST